MNVSELLAALPDDDLPATLDGEWARTRLQEILADLAKRPAPIGSLHRLWTVSELTRRGGCANGFPMPRVPSAG
jgi:hypothetical protein